MAKEPSCEDGDAMRLDEFLEETENMNHRGVVFRATLALRWKERWTSRSEGGETRDEILQQAWQGSDGAVEWREIPFVGHGRPPGQQNRNDQ